MLIMRMFWLGYKVNTSSTSTLSILRFFSAQNSHMLNEEFGSKSTIIGHFLFEIYLLFNFHHFASEHKHPIANTIKFD